MKQIKTQAIIEGIRSRKDRSIGLTVSTPELNPQEKALFFELQGINLELLITPQDDKDVEEFAVEADLEQKSQSQRIRNVLFVLWKQDPEGLEFPDYYKLKTEKYINQLKGLISDLPY